MDHKKVSRLLKELSVELGCDPKHDLLYGVWLYTAMSADDFDMLKGEFPDG